MRSGRVNGRVADRGLTKHWRTISGGIGHVPPGHSISWVAVSSSVSQSNSATPKSRISKTIRQRDCIAKCSALFTQHEDGKSRKSHERSCVIVPLRFSSSSSNTARLSDEGSPRRNTTRSGVSKKTLRGRSVRWYSMRGNCLVG